MLNRERVIRFLLRGPDKVNMQGFLVASGQNRKRWLAAGKRGQRPAAAQRATVLLRCSGRSNRVWPARRPPPRRCRGRLCGPAATPRQAAAIDMTGYWVSVVTED